MDLVARVREDAQRLTAEIEEQLALCRALRSPRTQAQIRAATEVSPEYALARKCAALALALKADIRALYELLELKNAAPKGAFGAAEVLQRTKQLEDALVEISARRTFPPGASADGGARLTESHFGAIVSLWELRRSLSECVLTRCLDEKRVFDATYGVLSNDALTARLLQAEHCSGETRLELQLLEQFAVVQRVLGAVLSQGVTTVRSDGPGDDGKPLRGGLFGDLEFDSGAQGLAPPDYGCGGCRVSTKPTVSNARSDFAPVETEAQSRQRSKLEEREVMIREVTLQCEELQRENGHILSEHGRRTDEALALETQLFEVRAAARKEIELLAPRVLEAEALAEALQSRVGQNTLDADFLKGLLRKKTDEATRLRLEISTRTDADDAARSGLADAQKDLVDITALAERRGRNATTALAARAAEIRNHKATNLRLCRTEEHLADVVDTSEAREAIITAQGAALALLEARVSASGAEAAESRARADDCEATAAQRGSELEALNRRFLAMYADGMTGEKKLAYAHLESQLASSQAKLRRAEERGQSLESKIFELELTLGSGGEDGGDAT